MTEEEKQAKLDQARKLIEEVNEAEKNDSVLNWRPWRLRRLVDPRGGM